MENTRKLAKFYPKQNAQTLASKDKRKDDEDNNLMSSYVNTNEKVKDVVNKLIFNKIMKVKQKCKATMPH